ncbi:MAG: hypothetical protein COS08_01580 [Euryarchaeota archaeon CG01_land_8_20_14_3_00_38_12]|nr:MAG: hypothetical protein COS08_01580 [Euryarchaeota archaeon CG01_land_8_20_14_3_00_38_12]
MKPGIAFIRGIGMFGKRNYSRQKILNCLKKIENRNIKILGMYGNDNILFLKGESIHYATVGRKIEKSLEKCFNEKFYVTTRAGSTLNGLVKNIKN